ncbi:cupin domain-containing protein [Leucobacter rhizosphaerae]|uniref:Cupin domain-containing protein n=1 Tax=Leucobacter rhizosphaerae TaxID=2932245 RepID=A0ABY4FTN4_9MICO|nr:cupin domain-containing protein [Leucobacter rhizosphaerae]UOQ59617.1 cupin domain-containing protein [Leucobacter rhizosphaerae]
MSTGAHSRVQLENEHFRVTEWTIDPGGVIPMHRHDFEYVVVPMVTDTMHVVTAAGEEIVAELVAGESYTRPAGSEHQVENRTSDSPVVFVEVEKLA